MTSAAFASLAIPPMEDSMDMSSPANNTYDDAIDIDVDFADATDDDRMLDDAEFARPGTATDDMMADAYNFDSTNAPVIEAEMQDSDAPFEQPDGDEELIDYDDDGVFATQDDAQPNFGDIAPQNTESGFLAPNEVATEPERVDEVPAAHDTTIDASSIPVLPEAEVATVAVPASDEQVSLTETHSADVDTVEQTQHEEYDGAHAETLPSEAPAEGEAGEAAVLHEEQPADEAVVPKQLAQLSGSLDVSGSFVADGPPTPTDTGLHPMTIQYGNSVWPVFKSRAQQDGLLKDDNLVSVSLNDFLDKCRGRLADEFDEGVSGDHDLVLGFGIIGLLLVENTSHASSTSLSDILEIYLNLYKNDGVDEVPPLSMTLTTQLKFTRHLALLKQAATEGKGMSELIRIHGGDSEVRYAEYEEYTDGEAGEKHGEEFDEEQEEVHYESNHETHDQHQEAEYHEEDQVHQNDDGNDADADEFPYEANYEDYGEDDGLDPENSTNEHPAYDETAADTLEQAEAQDPATDDGQTSATHGQAVVHPKSPASSAAVRGEVANETAEASVEDGEDDFADPSGEDAGQEGQQEDGAQVFGHDVVADSASAVDYVNHHESGQAVDNQNPDDELYFGTEDFLNEDFTDHAQGQGEDQDDATQYGPIDPAEDLVQVDDDDPNQANNEDTNHQDEPVHEDDDDQFHTALDLLEDSEVTEEIDTTAEHVQKSDAPALDEDDIGFSDDEEPASAAVTTNSPRTSLHGKRSFEEHVDEDEFEFEEPDQKKARAG